MTAPTYCADCENVHPDSRKWHPSKWLCMKFPRLEGRGFVVPGVWADSDPYQRAVHINGGACPLFTPARIAPVKEVAA